MGGVQFFFAHISNQYSSRPGRGWGGGGELCTLLLRGGNVHSSVTCAIKLQFISNIGVGGYEILQLNTGTNILESQKTKNIAQTMQEFV